jgi:hypothetical protein
MDGPLGTVAVGLASIAAISLYVAAADPQDVLDSGGLAWVPAVGAFGFGALMAAADGAAAVRDCREATQSGAVIAEENQRKAASRATAAPYWKRAATAARADDCKTVRALDPQIRVLDVELHDVVFARDVAIARCLSAAPVTSAHGT